MQLSARKVNRFLQRTYSGWPMVFYGREAFLFLATWPVYRVKDNRVFVRISRKELGNRLHANHYDLSRILDDLIKENLIRKEKGYDTVNVHVSFAKNFLYEE